MSITKVKTFLAAGALTGIIMATVVGLSVRNIARAVVTAPVQAQTTTQTTSNQGSSFVGPQHEEHESGGFGDD